MSAPKAINRLLLVAPAAVVVLLLLASLCLPAGGAAARALAQPNTPGITLQVEAGYGDNGSYLVGEWMPVRVAISNPAGAPSTRVRVEVDSKGYSDSDTKAVYAREVDLPAQARKEVTLYAYSDTFRRTVDVRLVSGGTVVASRQAAVNPVEKPQSLLVGVASSDSGLLNVLENSKAGYLPSALPSRGGYSSPQAGFAGTISVVHIDLRDIPALPAALNSLGALVLDDVESSSLSPEQVRAVTIWVGQGGTLIVVGRPGGADAASAFASVLPVSVPGGTAVGSLKSLADLVAQPLESGQGGSVPIVNSRLRTEPQVGARALAMSDGVPLVALRSLGEGHVAYLALSPGVAPLKGWDGIVPLFKRLLAEHRAVGLFNMARNPGGYYGGYGSAFGAGPFDVYGSIFDLPALDLPDPMLIGAFMLLYIVVIGPINFLILRRTRRSEFGWLTVPALVLLFSVAAYVVGRGAKGNDLVLIRGNISYWTSGADAGSAAHMWGLFSPQRGTYRLRMGSDALVTALSGSGSENPVRVTAGGGETRIENVIVQAGSLKSYIAESVPNTDGPLEADLRLGDNEIVGKLRNRGSSGLRDVALFRGGESQHIAFIPAGGSADVRLGADLQPFDASSPVRLLPPPLGVSAPSSGPYYSRSQSNEQREYNRRVNLLNIALGPVVWGDVPTDMNVTAVAWAQTAAGSVSLEGSPTRDEDLDVWVGRLPVSAGSDGGAGAAKLKAGSAPVWTYNPGTEPARSAGVYSSSMTLQPFVDLNYTLPAGTEPRSLTVAARFPLPAGVDMLAYNTRTGAWDTVAAAGSNPPAGSGGVPLSNPGDYVGGAGDVTLRLRSSVAGATPSVQLNNIDLVLNQE